MKRRPVLRAIGLGAVGMALSFPLWSTARRRKAVLEAFRIDPVNDHVRHGAFDLFKEPVADRIVPVIIERHRFFANGYSPGERDPLYVRIRSNKVTDQNDEIHIQFEGLELVSTSHPEQVQIVHTSTDVATGDIIIPLEVSEKNKAMKAIASGHIELNEAPVILISSTDLA